MKATPGSTCGHADCVWMDGYLGGQRDAYALAAASLRARGSVLSSPMPVEAWTRVMAAADEMEARRDNLSQTSLSCWAPVTTARGGLFQRLVDRLRGGTS